VKEVVVANWKMNKTCAEARSFAKNFKELVRERNREVVICPPFTSLWVLQEELKGTGIKIGAQDVFYKDWGAYTGEISPPMLVELNCEYVIVGHSERRNILNETDEIVRKKLFCAVEHGLIPILCVGEKLEERERGETEKVVEKQLVSALKGISEDLKVVVAYEPVWAIGTGKNATPEQAQEVHAFIRSVLEGLVSRDFSEKTPILYGGSVKPENAKALLSQKDINGLLVGGASLNPESFARIVLC